MQPIQQEIEKAYFVDNREFKVLSRWEWRRRDSMQVWGVVLEIGRLDDRQILMASAIEPLLIWMTRTRLGFDRIESNRNQKICSNATEFPFSFFRCVSTSTCLSRRPFQLERLSGAQLFMESTQAMPGAGMDL